MDFISKIGIHSDIEKMQDAANDIIQLVGWNNYNQIGLNRRFEFTNPWLDAVGSLFKKDSPSYGAKESDYTVFNSIPEYLKDSINELQLKQNINLGRARLMRLLPHRGLSVHRDFEVRYHYVIETNSKAYFCFNNDTTEDLDAKATCYHLPADGNWYKIDTTQTHWVYNGGETPRIHLVVSTY